MKRVSLRIVGLAVVAVSVFAVAGAASASAALFPQCPPVGVNTGCAILITINPNGTTMVQADPEPPNNEAYDGEDDTLVGIQNNATFPLAAINLSSTTEPIFGFDGDGICDPGLGGTGPDPGCPPGSSSSQSYVPESAGGTGYEGPNNTFSNIDLETEQSGTVNFIKPLATGGTAYFALEESLTAADVGVGTITPGGPPTPPVVTITSGPALETSDTNGTFTFEGVVGGTYECSIDGGAFAPCATGQTFGPFNPGDHQFKVRETLLGVTGPEATYLWTVDIPKQCVLKVARARVFVFTKKSKVRLVIRYTLYHPAKVTVGYKLKGSKGSLNLGSATKNFQKTGVFRLPVKLGKPEMGKVRAAKEFTVHFKIGGSPKLCKKFYTKKLTLPEKVQNQTVWFQSDSVFAPGGP